MSGIRLNAAQRAGVLAAVVLVLAAMLPGCGAPGPLIPEQRSSGHESRPPPAPTVYRVQRGDTLYSIAFRYGLDWRRVAAWNDIGAPYTIHVGERIRLKPQPDMRPAVATDETARRPAADPPGPSERETPAQDPPAISGGAEPPGDDAPAESGDASSTPEPGESMPEPVRVPDAATRRVAGIDWRWPTTGRLARRFDAGATRKGILIAGEGGQPVRAAADGEVVYSGSGLIGYGELVIIKHSAGMLSAYAHNRERLVDEGDRVRAGQTIGRMGRNERDETVLHFEIRRDGKPVDPSDYLPAR